MQQTERLIVFTRYPEPGRTKTRMIPVLGEAGAAELQRRMTEHTLRAADALAKRRPLDVEVRFEGGTKNAMARWLGARREHRPQGGGDIGTRMAQALKTAFRESVLRAVLIGTDIPGLSVVLLEEAFDRLADHDLVFGPAADGGYYLIGARSDGFDALTPVLFDNIPWGTDAVFAETLAALDRKSVSVHRLPVLRDVDRPEDLPVWEAARR